MRKLARFFARLRNFAVNRRNDERLQEEIEQHIALQTEDNIRAGMPPDEARRRARLDFGPPGPVRDDYRAEESLPLIESAAQDVRYAVRILRRSWGFTAVAATSLALAIGANTTIFSVMKHVLLERLDVPHADQLRLLHWHGDRNVAVNNIWGVTDPGSSTLGTTSFSYPAYEELRRDNRVLEDLFAFKDFGTVDATIEGEAQVVQVEAVSGNFFEQMQVQPELGRPIEASDDRIGAPSVGLISAGLWARAFGSSPLVLGRTVKLNMIPVTIIGVTPLGFTGANGAQSPQDFFIPLSAQPLVEPWGKKGSLIGNSSPEVWWLNIMGRAKPGVSDTTVQAALNPPLAALVQASLQPGATRTIPKLDVQDGSRGLFVSKRTYATPVSVLIGVVALVLLLACANIASLLLARSTARQREIAMRMALGAGRARVLRGVLTESLLLSALGGVLGVALAFAGCRILPALLTDPWKPSEFTMPLDWVVLLFTGAITVASGLLFGIVPAWLATRNDVGALLKSATRTSTRRRRGIGGKAIVGFQVMLSTLLVIGAFLFVGTLWNLARVNPGFRTDHLVIFAIAQPGVAVSRAD